jgi:ubiquinone/menaquinone biosynthesis C-methylase UbiE
MNNRKCPICGSSNNELLIKSKDYLVLKGVSADFSVYLCKNCSNGFSFPFMTNTALKEYYPDDYNCFSNHKGFVGWIQRIKSGNDVSIIVKLLRNTGKELFEIGSGSGFFLSLLAEKGLKISGLEPSLSGAKYAKENFSIDLSNCFFEDFVSENKYDMVIAFHVLEHFNCPVSALIKIKYMIKEQGYLYLKVPRLDSWPAKVYGKFWHGYDLPRHRFHFTKKGLIELLNNHGFEILHFKSDYDPLATIRFAACNSFEGKKNKILFRIFNRLPPIVKLFVASVVEVVMRPFISGRMSIIARKKIL